MDTFSKEAIGKKFKLSSIDFSAYISLAFLFGIAAQFRAMDGFSFLRAVITSLERRIGILYAIIIVTSIFSPLILNDVVVLILTPVIISYAKKFNVDIAPLLVAELTFTNIASSLTPFGNPQNILIWSYTKITFQQFVLGASLALIISGVFAALSLFPFHKQYGGAKENPSLSGSKLPGAYLLVVILAIITSDIFELEPYISLGIGFFLGFFFTFRSVGKVGKEFDFKSLLTLYLFVGSITLVSMVVGPLFTKFAAPVGEGMQPYSGIFVGVLSNIISNVPATQLVLSVTTVSTHIAPKLAVEAGLAGNIDPIASFANLLVLLMVRSAGLGIKKTIALQFLIGIVSFIPALLI
jgi:Na+/H+ antiporter NhaD/arsenite permease-like protein